MNNKLSKKQMIAIASMLFGMFFGAGNLIFPIHMGQIAGSNMYPAIIGFIITGVTLPLLGIAAMGISKSEGLFDLSSKVGKGYAFFFTCALYLTIGPFFAIPRCAGTSYTVGLAPIFGDSKIPLLIFSVLFFGIVLLFSLKPNGILTWIGKILNPLFLILLAVLVVASFVKPMGNVSSAVVDATYNTKPFFSGFLEGYNTMDALAALAFGIVVIEVIRREGITEPNAVASNTVKAGIFSCIFMGVIYFLTTVMGAKSTGVLEVSDNGGTTFYELATHYFGKGGSIILALMITLACLKTAIALVQSCSETFEHMFAKGPKYNVWAIIFTIVSFGFANLGLNSIIAYSIPILMFLYPLAITLILVSLFGKFFKYDRIVYLFVTIFTLIASIFDLIHNLPSNIYNLIAGSSIDSFATKVLPFYQYGLGWLVPAGIGLAIGLIVYKVKK